MKSQVSFLLDKMKKEGKILTEDVIHDIAYAFQEAIVETLAKRLFKVATAYEAKTVAVAGGVSANQRLIGYIEQLVNAHTTISPLQFLFPVKKVYSTDNGAMIGVAGILAY
jgi:N6-L-threonylcarbamoyladenine synthase